MIKIGIIGAGASGTMLAYQLNKVGKYKIYLFERSEHIGKKILVTGNGRCNITNMNLKIDGFNNSCILPLINKYNPKHLRNILSEMGLKTVEDEEGRVYPFSNSANSVVNALLNGLKGPNIEIITSANVTDVKKSGDGFAIYYNYTELDVDKVVVCSGGLASNGSDFFEILGEKGLNIVPTSPVLCPIETIEKTISLSGLRIKCRVSVNEFIEDGEVLFKDNGLSGIVIMNASRYVKEGDIIHLNLCRGAIFNSFNDLELNLPKMVAHEIISRSNNNLNTALEMVEDLTFTVKRKYAYKHAHVMRGGISLDEINLENFEVKKIKGMYILGEALDIDGMCGGYNLHFAFSSALALGDYLNK